LGKFPHEIGEARNKNSEQIVFLEMAYMHEKEEEYKIMREHEREAKRKSKRRR
jgi:hypothetical protein